MQGETFIFFGQVGSGKGTQASLLQDFLKTHNGNDTVYISSGNEYRKIIESNSYTSSLVKVILDRGNLLPNFLTNSIFVNIFSNNILPEKNSITDGYPRTIGQAECFEEAMKFYNRENIRIIYIELGKEEALKRMKLRNRHDDTDEGIARRFEEYEKNVIPAMNYFKDKEGYKIYTINGEQAVEKVHSDIIKSLNFTQ